MTTPHSPLIITALIASTLPMMAADERMHSLQLWERYRRRSLSVLLTVGSPFLPGGPAVGHWAIHANYRNQAASHLSELPARARTVTPFGLHRFLAARCLIPGPVW